MTRSADDAVTIRSSYSNATTQIDHYMSGGAIVHLIFKYTVPWAHTILTPKRHFDRFIRFCRAHGRDQHNLTTPLRM